MSLIVIVYVPKMLKFWAQKFKTNLGAPFINVFSQPCRRLHDDEEMHNSQTTKVFSRPFHPLQFNNFISVGWAFCTFLDTLGIPCFGNVEVLFEENQHI